VIDQWLHYFANEPDCGWPPPEPLGNHRWSGLLGGRPLSWWKNVTWQPEAVDCSLGGLATKTRGFVSDMRAEITAKTADQVTQRRFDHALFYILTNGGFPKRLIAMNADDGLLVLDGNHRAAAFTASQIMPAALVKAKGWTKPESKQEVWVGTHLNGELPLT
jgi:hypothetical protein